MTENLLCAYCLIEDRVKTPAVTLMEGTAMCEPHAPQVIARAEAAQDRKQRLVDEAMARVRRNDPRY